MTEDRDRYVGQGEAMNDNEASRLRDVIFSVIDGRGELSANEARVFFSDSGEGRAERQKMAADICDAIREAGFRVKAR